MEYSDSNFPFAGTLDTRDATHTEFNDDWSVKGETKYPNVDMLYGVYSSKQEAFEALSTPNDAGNNALVLGKTVGVLENGKIVEYWFESACESVNDLVKKGGSDVAILPTGGLKMAGTDNKYVAVNLENGGGIEISASGALRLGSGIARAYDINSLPSNGVPLLSNVFSCKGRLCDYRLLFVSDANQQDCKLNDGDLVRLGTYVVFRSHAPAGNKYYDLRRYKTVDDVLYVYTDSTYQIEVDASTQSVPLMFKKIFDEAIYELDETGTILTITM